MGALALQQSRGRPRSRLYRLSHRIAARFEPAVARRFLAAIERLQARMSEAELVSALASASDVLIQAAAHTGEIELILATSGLTDVFTRTTTATGRAGAEVLSDALGASVRFNATDPNAIMFARRQSAQLVRAVGEDTREAIRIIIAAAQQYGLTIQQQARAIKEMVGLPPNWVRAPLNFAQEIRDGTVNYGRRLSAVDKQKIRSRIKAGTVTEEFVAEMQGTYTQRLVRRRALNIARTETLTASNHGLRTGWRQARDDGVLPTTAKRVVVVTPDERLRELHAEAQRMNPDGVGLDEPFRTPWGLLDGPPWAADPVNCRCSEGLVFPGLEGAL